MSENVTQRSKPVVSCDQNNVMIEEVLRSKPEAVPRASNKSSRMEVDDDGLLTTQLKEHN